MLAYTKTLNISIVFESLGAKYWRRRSIRLSDWLGEGDELVYVVYVVLEKVKNSGKRPLRLTGTCSRCLFYDDVLRHQ